jgi:hypothetical protein
MDVSPNKNDHTIAFQSKRPQVKMCPGQNVPRLKRPQLKSKRPQVKTSLGQNVPNSSQNIPKVLK